MAEDVVNVDPERKQWKDMGEPTKYAKNDMWGWDFRRLDILLQAANLIGTRVRMGDTGDGNSRLREYFALLETTFLELNPLLYKTQRADIEPRLNRLKNVILGARAENLSRKEQSDAIEDLRQLDKVLRMARQDIGIGVQQKVQSSMRDRLRRGSGLPV